jgi:integrase
MKLSDAKIKTLKPNIKRQKLSDGGGLHLLVLPSGVKTWQIRYVFGGKEKTYSVGVYPEISLSEARQKRFDIKKLIKSGIDPNQVKKAEKEVQTLNINDRFLNVALEWHSKNINKWTDEHAAKLKNWIERDIAPVIGHIQISKIKSPDVLAVVKSVEDRGALDVARRVLSICSQVLRYGIPLGKCNYDVTVGINKTLEVRKRQNYKSIPVEDFPKLLKDIENHNCNPLTKYGLMLIALTFVRSSELREAKWSEINFEKAEWRIPAERMKMKELHIVPLSKQVIDILNKIKNLGFESEYILPSIYNPKKVMSENTMLYALYDMGYHNKMTVHGFRQIASTILNENGFRSDVIERQLSHAERDKVRASYNHAQYLKERREMMQWWANFIDTQKTS